MKKDQYVILTGSKNNAGDYLIKHRAKELFSILKPNRKIIDINGWEKLNDENLKVINNSKALILMGGPALVKDFHPRVYALRDSIDEIETEFSTMGIGWNDISGSWDRTRNMKFTNQSLKLLDKLCTSNLFHSVRDYQAFNVLKNEGVKNIMMTGCPAYYSLDHINTSIESSDLHTIGISLGVVFLHSKRIENQMKDLILKTKETYEKSNILVAFHHSLDKKYSNSHDSKSYHLKKHKEFSNWLDANDINFEDISGSFEKLSDFYRKCDLHIGYRVHAHIFMSSLSKPSLLLIEDGRGQGVKESLGGLCFNAFEDVDSSNISKILNRLFGYEQYNVSNKLVDEVLGQFKLDYFGSKAKAQQTRTSIDSHYKSMVEYIKHLP